MADQEPKDIKRSLKDLKKMAKQQKKTKKKEKKKAKTEKKIAKQEAKLRKKGVFLEDVTEVEAVEEQAPEEFKAELWVRKSTEDMPYVEKRIDRLAERKESSSLHDMFQEKYGEVLMVPETFIEYELSEAEKRRLERLRAADEEKKAPAEVTTVASEQEQVAEEAQAAEEADTGAKKGLFKRKAKKAKEVPKAAPKGAITAVSSQEAYASWGQRIVAFIIDCIIFSPLAVLGLLVIVAQPLVALLYFTILESIKGQSIGKMIMKIKVTTMEGEKVGFGKSFIQALGKVIPLLSLIDFIIGLIDRENKQRLFNRISKTIVVRKEAVIESVKSDVATEAKPTTR